MEGDPRTFVLLGSLVVIGVAMALCALRIARGPTHFDRVLGLDCMVLDVVAAVLVLSMLFETDAFIDSVLAIALLGFVATISLSAYLEGSLVA